MYTFTERLELKYLLCRGKQVQISDSWFVGNQADNSGAGLVFDKTSAYVQGSVFKNNRAQVSRCIVSCQLITHIVALSAHAIFPRPAACVGHHATLASHFPIALHMLYTWCQTARHPSACLTWCRVEQLPGSIACRPWMWAAASLWPMQRHRSAGPLR